MQVNDTGESDIVLSIQSVRDHTHVEEDFENRWIFEDGFERSRVLAVGAEGCESAVFEEMHVDEVRVGAVGGVDVQFKDFQWAGAAKTAAVGVKEERWDPGFVYERDVIERLSQGKGSLYDGAPHDFDPR